MRTLILKSSSHLNASIRDGLVGGTRWLSLSLSMFKYDSDPNKARMSSLCLPAGLLGTYTEGIACNTRISQTPEDVNMPAAFFTTTPHLTASLRMTLYEAMTTLVFPLCSHLPHSSAPTPVSSATSIIDLQGVTIGNMWSLRNHLQQASTMATTNYPETLNTIVIVNSPSFFPTIWGWIKVSLNHILHKRFVDVT